MTNIKRFFAIILILASSLIVLFIASFLLIVRFNLDSMFIKKQIESIASSELGREVLIEGDIDMQYGLWPLITIDNIKMGNSKGWETDSQFVDIGNLRIQFGIFPLLKKHIRIREISLDGVLINLEKNNAGESNWDMIPGSANTTDSNSEDHESWQKIFENFETKLLLVKDLTVNYYDRHSDKTHKIEIEHLEGSVVSDEPIKLAIQGFYKKKPYKIKLTGGRVQELIDSDKSFQITLQGDFLESVLKVEGRINDLLELKKVKLSFSLEGNNIEHIENFLDLDLPNPEYYHLSGQSEISESVFRLYDLDVHFGHSMLNAEVTADFSKQKPDLDGKIKVKNLDVIPFLEMLNEENVDEPEMDINNLFKPLGLISADIDVSIEQLTSLPVYINNINTRIEILNNELKAPFDFDLEGIKVNGGLNLGLNDDIPTISLNLKSHKPNLNNFLRFVDIQDINAGLESLDFELVGSGKKLTSILESLKASLRLNGATFYNESVSNEQSRNAIDIDVLKLDLDPEIGLVGSVHGELLYLPTSLNISTCDLATYVSGEFCDVNLRAYSLASRMKLSGNIKNINGYTNIDLKLDLIVKDINDYLRFYGVIPDKVIPFELSLEVNSSKNELNLDLLQFNLGQSELTGKFSKKSLMGATNYILSLNAALLDLNQLNEVMTRNGDRIDNSGIETLQLDIPVLPTSLESLNTDINIDIKRISIGTSEFKDTDIYIQIEKGALEQSRFKTNIGETKFNGQISIDVAEEHPNAHIVLSADQVDVGSLLKDFRVHDNLYLESDKIELEIILRGRNLTEILDKSSLIVSLENGEWIIYEDNDLRNINVDISKGTINAQPNKPIILHLTATYGAIPITVDIETDNILRGLTRIEQKSPFELHAVIASTDIQLSGLVTYPLGSKNSELMINISGTNANDINDMLEIDIPDIHPYHFSSKLLISGDNFQFNNIEFRVGDSAIEGDIDYVTTGEYQHLYINLYSHYIELNKIMREKLITTDPKDSKASDKTKLAENQEIIFEPLITMMKLRSLNADININLAKILLNDRLLGALELVGNLHGGQLKINHFDINTPGGTIQNLISADIFQNSIKAEFVTIIENLDYGFLVKSLGTESGDGGILDLNLNLSSYGEDLYEFDDNTNGFININILPRSVSAKVFDIWATNIIFNILPNWSGKTKPKVNCLVGNLEINNGIIDPKKLYIDTTNVRVRATGYIDLRNQWLNLLFKPVPKRPQLFDLGIPINVTGKFDNYKITPDLINVGWYFVRIYYTVFEYVLQLFGKGVIPEDGSDICGQYVETNSSN